MIKGVPYDAEIAFLESTGTQWIDTGVDVYGATDLGFDIVFTPVNAAQEQRVISTEGSSPTYDVYFASATQINLRQGGYSATVANGDLIQCEYKNGIWKVYRNGSLALTKSQAFSAVANSKNVFLMVRANNSSSLYCFKGKYYGAKIWIDDVLVRDYIPVRVGQVGYLYDRVTRRLFGNAGTGAFTLGTDVATPVMSLHRMALPQGGGND